MKLRFEIPNSAFRVYFLRASVPPWRIWSLFCRHPLVPVWPGRLDDETLWPPEFVTSVLDVAGGTANRRGRANGADFAFEDQAVMAAYAGRARSLAINRRKRFVAA